MHKRLGVYFKPEWSRQLNTLRDRALPCLAGHVAEVLVVGVAIDLRLERVERGAECLGLARLAVDLLVGGVAVGETLEDRAGQGVAVREDERIAEGVRNQQNSTRV